MPKVQKNQLFQHLNTHLAYLTPTNSVIKKQTEFQGKVWTKLDQLTVLWERIKHFFQTGHVCNNASTLKLINKNISLIDKDIKALSTSVSQEKILFKEFDTNFNRLIEMREGCLVLKKSIANKRDLAKITKFENAIYKLKSDLSDLLDTMLENETRLEHEVQAKKKAKASPIKSPPSQKAAIRSEKKLAKMLKNAFKAIEEHRSKDTSHHDVYVTPQEVMLSLQTITSPKIQPPLTFTHTFAEAQGPRDDMEDAHFCIEIPQGLLAGVFDGHGGKKISNYASQAFQAHFSKMLETTNGNVRLAFEKMLDKIHTEVSKNHAWDKMGSTAVVSFIDPKTHLIYTATLGDSEANRYPIIDNKRKSHPLSCVRDWSSKRDAKRAADAIGIPEIATAWPKAKNPKVLRYPYPYLGVYPFLGMGVNVSRAIGDVGADIHKKPAISHKPKVSVNRVQPGDLLILACDGLKDYVPEDEVVKVINRALAAKQDPAQALTDYAINARQAHDNVTVLAIEIK